MWRITSTSFDNGSLNLEPNKVTLVNHEKTCVKFDWFGAAIAWAVSGICVRFSCFLQISWYCAKRRFIVKQRMSVFRGQTKEFGGSDWPKLLQRASNKFFRAGIHTKLWQATVYLTRYSRKICTKLLHLLARGGLSTCGRPNKKWK